MTAVLFDLILGHDDAWHGSRLYDMVHRGAHRLKIQVTEDRAARDARGPSPPRSTAHAMCPGTKRSSSG